MSDIRYASQKALYYLRTPWHNPDLFGWFQDGADVPVAIADGSARNTNPQADGAPFNPTEDSGTPFLIVFNTSADPNFPVLSNYDGYYFMTSGGLRGRDLR